MVQQRIPFYFIVRMQIFTRSILAKTVGDGPISISDPIKTFIAPLKTFLRQTINQG